MDLVPTSHGLVGLDPPRGRGGGPLVIVVEGSYTRRAVLADLGGQEAETAVIELPGQWAPTFQRYDVDVFASAFDEVIASRFADRAIVLAGFSTGAVVALGMMAPQIRAVVAVEPFFSTSGLWPLRSWIEGQLPFSNSELTRFAAEVFGYSQGGCQPRHFTIKTKAPIVALVGDCPLAPPRAIARMPSLTSASDRETLIQGGADLVVVEGVGHAIPGERPEAIRSAVRHVLSEFHLMDEESPVGGSCCT